MEQAQIRRDILGGITAGVVALPLALAFGEASGMGPMAGLWGAIIVGFFASLFGGTQTQISGPTGPMIVVFGATVGMFTNEPGLIFTSVMLAGVILVLLGAVGVGKYIRLVPYPVVSGFMCGIGCIIILLQLPALLGIAVEGKGVIASVTALFSSIQTIHPTTALIGLLSLAVVFFWPARWGKFFPGALAALVICTLLSLGLSGVSTLGPIPTGLPSLVMPTLVHDKWLLVIEAATVLALLCAIDSLLTSLVADKMTQTRHQSNKELFGQGIGNFLAGLFGSIPGAGATMRTVVNIRSGGSTRLSGMVHSVFLLSVVLALGPLASQIPQAVLAGILLKVGYDIIDWEYIKKAHKGPKWDLALMLTVLLMTVFVDLIIAVATGVVLASLVFVKKTADKQLQAIEESSQCTSLQEVRDDIAVFELPTPLSFGATSDLPHFVRENVKGRSVVVLHLEGRADICLSAAKAVESIAEEAKNSNKQLIVSGVNERIARIFSGLGLHQHMPKEHWFQEKERAVAFAIKGSR